MRIDAAIKRAVDSIEHGSVQLDSARLDAELLLMHVLQQSRSFLFAHPEYFIDASELGRYLELVDRRACGEPVAYLLGEREFWSLPLQVNPSVLIPRPDTECLVEAVLNAELPERAVVVDLGTGSGAIALALATERKHWHVMATDQSIAAIETAANNASRLRASNKACSVNFVRADWLSSFVDDAFDLIVSNPPYIAPNDQHLDVGDLRFEPQVALVSGDNGMADIRKILIAAGRCLRSGGYLVVEHGFQQADEVVAEVLTMPSFTSIESKRDYGGNPRFVMARRL